MEMKTWEKDEGDPNPAEVNFSEVKNIIPTNRSKELTKNTIKLFLRIFFLEKCVKFRYEAVNPPAKAYESQGITPHDETSKKIFSIIFMISKSTGKELG